MKHKLLKYVLLGFVLGSNYFLSQGAALKLSQSVPPFSAVENALFALNNTRVVYVLVTNSFNDYNVYSVPVTGGNPINLSQLTPPKSLNAFSLKISPDGTRAFYIVNGASPSRFDLYSVPVDGSSLPTQLSSISVNNGAVQDDFAITPDGNTVIYRADQDNLNRVHLYSASTDQAGSSVAVSGVMYPNFADVDSLGITPDGSSIIFEADLTVPNNNEILKVPIGGGAVVSLSGPNVVGGGASSGNYFVISPTGSRVVFRLDKEVAGKNEFYSVPISGGVPPTKLNAPLDNAEDTAIGRSVFSPDGNRVLYMGQDAVGPSSPRYLFNVASDNPSDRRQVNPNFDNISKQVLFQSGSKNGFAWNAKGDRIVYVADQFQNGIFRLFSALVNGGPVITLNDAFIVNGFVSTMAVVPNGRAVLYTGNKESVGKKELYFVPIKGGVNLKVSDPVVPADAAGLYRFEMSSDSKFVIYTSAQESKDKIELYITTIPIVRDATADFDGDFVNDILLKKGRSLRILTRNNPTNTFIFKDFLTLLPKKHKILASKDLNGDNRPELIVKKGKTPLFTLTVTTNLLLTNAGVKLPTLAKKFKVSASGFIDTNTVVVATKKKTMRVYFSPFGSSTNTTNVIVTTNNFIERINPKGFKVVGFGSYNDDSAVILRKKKQFSAIAIVSTLSNGFTFGTITTNIGNLPKKYKGFAAAPYLEEINPDIDIVIRKGKEIRLLDLLPNSTNTYPAKVLAKKGQEKKYKVVGPK